MDPLTGRSLIAGQRASLYGAPFYGYNPADAHKLAQPFYPATPVDVDRAVNAAIEVASTFAVTTGKQRGHFLRTIAQGIDDATQSLAAQAHSETSLPIPRLIGEVARTSGQLRLFASVVEEGSWVFARIDSADPARTPPRPDVRSMLIPIGPVAVFGASNFPLAFSVAGGDTASALASGNPVIIKAHPAHPGTSELVANIIVSALAICELPPGIFSLLFDSGHQIGAALVQHPGIRAVAFTGSSRGGRALITLAAERPDPIPVYAEMGSTNPVFILPGALNQRAEQLASGLHASFTLGGGQFCTKPGLVFLEAAQANPFTQHLRILTQAAPAFSLLTSSIAAAYNSASSQRESLQTALGSSATLGFSAQVLLLETSSEHFLAHPQLSEEVFGPTTLLVQCSTRAEMLRAAHSLEGHLTATILGTEDDLAQSLDLLRILETKVGRVLFNGFPTGVEVCHAMVHGGPWPATSDSRSTSVGTQAIFRFTRPIAYQGMPQSVLPPALQDHNPLKILRMHNGAYVMPNA